MPAQFFINGQWISPSSGRLIDSVGPATREVIGQIAVAEGVEINRAVAAARAAFASWAATPVHQRIEIVSAAIAALAAQKEEVACLLSREVGMPTVEARDKQVTRALEIGRLLCESASSLPWQEVSDGKETSREPTGVAVAITSWSRPVEQLIIKVGSALLDGCTVVLKPSELASRSAFPLVDALARAGVPAGVPNLVSGRGAVGEALVSHPGVDVVTFTGATEVGRHVALSGETEVTRASERRRARVGSCSRTPSPRGSPGPEPGGGRDLELHPAQDGRHRRSAAARAGLSRSGPTNESGVRPTRAGAVAYEQMEE